MEYWNTSVANFQNVSHLLDSKILSKNEFTQQRRTYIQHMSLLQNIKNRIFNRSLQQLGRQNQATRKFPGFEKAQSIGILFDATELSNREFVLQYADQLNKRGKKLKLLGFFDSKLEETNFTFPYFNRKNLDWVGRPTGEKVRDFSEQAFDLLINLDRIAKPQTEYVCAMSRAHLRVGPVSDHTFCYELMLDKADTKDLKTFIQQMEFILEKTNSRRHEITNV